MQVIQALVAENIDEASAYQEPMAKATEALANVKEDVSVAQAVIKTKTPKKAKSKAGSSAGDGAAPVDEL